MAIKIDFLSDVDKVIRDTENVGDSLKDVADELDKLGETRGAEKASDQLKDLGDDAAKMRKDVEDSADRAGDAVEDAFDGSTKGAKRELSSLEKDAAAAFRSIANDADRSGKKVGDSQRAGLNRASEGLGEFRDEANSTAREAAASFDGSADSIQEAFQEVAANAFAGFGPAGAAAGLALAAGLGIAMSALQGEADRVNEIGEAVSDLAGEIRDAGGNLDDVDFEGRMADWGLSIQDTKEWWELFQDSAKTGLELIEDKARKAGIGWEDAFKGTKGSVEDSERALKIVNAQLKNVRENADTVSDSMTGALDIDMGSKQQIEALEDLKKGFEENIDTLDRAEYQNKLLAEAGIETAASMEAAEEAAEREAEATERQAEAADRAAEAIIGKADALDRVSGANISAEEAAIRYADTVQASSATILENGETIDINTEAGRANREALLNTANAATALRDAQIEQGASTADITAKSETARQSFINQADAAGYTRAEAEALADQYGLIPGNVDTYVKAHNVANTEAEINGVARPRTSTVTVNADTGNAEYAIAMLNGRRVQVHVDAIPRPGVPMFN